MQLEMGSTPAPGVASRRSRRGGGPRAESLSSESVREAEEVTTEGASHDARGGRAPLLQHSSGLAPASELAYFGPKRLQVRVLESHLLDLFLAADGHGTVEPVKGDVQLPQLAGVTGQIEGNG